MPVSLEKIREIKNANEKNWLQIKEVCAVGIGLTKNNETGIIISIEKNTEQVQKKIPSQIEDVPIEIQITGKIKAF